MRPPILVSDNFDHVSAGITDPDVEGIIWKNAVPLSIINLITSQNFRMIKANMMPQVTLGRDLWRREVVVQRPLKDINDELAAIDAHTQNIRDRFHDFNRAAPIMRGANRPSIHYVSPDPVILTNQVPHIDVMPDNKTYSGKRGAEWQKIATAGHYPCFKVVAALNQDSDTATIMIPSCDKGEEDITHPTHYPHADQTNAVHAQPGDIAILKQYVTLHAGPSSIERRWFTMY